MKRKFPVNDSEISLQCERNWQDGALVPVSDTDTD